MTLPDLFPGFDARHVETEDATIFIRSAGNGPPLLLLHGYPQTHVHWHRLAPELTDRFTVIVADLRGYGASSIPASNPDHSAYSKRTMALDMLAMMEVLSHAAFHVGGHDRGGRVAYRMALDHPDRIKSLLLFDIVPTLDVWNDMRWNTAISAYHWPFLAQPAPMPETLIAADPKFYSDWTIKSWAGGKTLDHFDSTAVTHYHAQMSDPARVHAMCEDYRAGATIDRELDEADSAAGKTIDVPTLMMWSESYLVARSEAGPEKTWQRWCTNLIAHPIESGHFLAEENPDACQAAISDFLEKNPVILT
ncbi:MAG: alpha/beta fold hydrolase [Hyphomicrobiaceae bacterium]